MLLNLKAEYARKNMNPNARIMNALGCSTRTAYNKLCGISEITVSEAIKIINTDFANDNFTIDYLFASK